MGTMNGSRVPTHNKPCTTGDLVVEAADARLRGWAVPTSFLLLIAGLIAIDHAESLRPWAHPVVIIGMLLFPLATFARQRISVVGISRVLVIERRLSGLTWSGQRIDFADVREIWRGSPEEASGSSRGRRSRWFSPVTLTRWKGKPVLLAVYGNPQEADEVASKMASALGCGIRGREAENAESPSRSAAVPEITACGSGMVPTPEEELRVEIETPGRRARGMCFVIAFLFGAFLVLNVLGVLSLEFGRHLLGGNSLWIVLPVLALGMIASLAAAWKLYRNRYATALLVTAAPGRLEITQPRWVAPPRRLILRAADEAQIDVVRIRGWWSHKSALRITTRNRMLIIGRGQLARDLERLAAALKRAFHAEGSVSEVVREVQDGGPFLLPSSQQKWYQQHDLLKIKPINMVAGLLILVLIGAAVAVGLEEWLTVLGLVSLMFVIFGCKKGTVWWLKRRRLRSGYAYETFAGHFSSLAVPPLLLEDIYEHLSKSGEWVSGMPVLHGDHLHRIYGLDVKGNARTWVCELAEKHGLPIPTTAELVEVTTVDDLVRVVAQPPRALSLRR